MRMRILRMTMVSIAMITFKCHPQVVLFSRDIFKTFFPDNYFGKYIFFYQSNITLAKVYISQDTRRKRVPFYI